jgi:hypothetical protein
MQVKLDRETD